ncbi:hypothetical protein P9Z71_11465 [Glaesserella parasuis]|uniref:hypothetical protein n=1 Tax=Glaesserella parasuis TaxID=738 RepID=UPI0003AC3B13|nr:hypothetical protein [Glaesserella parasuis]ATW43347.1 hypothetical protein A2U20_05830 [Glaesserella parasuis D74]EQA10810.1 hypothetical protein HPSD74_0510 [Glaesserella parasuis D74]MDG6310817.1 hypothetical protein [Glaesserella parasuis]MDP0316697.1 hypothetical protein [Glaesserella parasuis]
MFTEEKRKKILDGAYCVTRAGKKAKLIYTSNYGEKLSHLFIILDNELKMDYPVRLNYNFKFNDTYESIFDIIDLWTNHLYVNNH